MKRYIELMLLGVALLISGCAIQTDGQSPPTAKVSTQERKARQLFLQGHYKQSAVLYQQLASEPSARQDFLRLRTAQTLLKMGLDDQAKAYLDLIVPGKLKVQQYNQLYLMYAHLNLNSGNAVLALKNLQYIKVPSLSPQQKPAYYEMSAFSYALMGQEIESVQARLALEPYLHTELKKENNNIAILELLSLLSNEALEVQLRKSKAETYSGWLELEKARRQYPGGKQFTQALNEWAQEHPRHPAQALIASGYFTVSGFKLGNVSDIAVLLPESGLYSAHANALKAGFMAAYERQVDDDLRPNIRFYNTHQVNIALLYQQAVVDGAQLVIGPLNKKYIQELAESSDLVVPVMALNYVQGLAKSNLYQFALSPLDEAQQAAKQARFSGYENAIILAPNTRNGERVSQYFQESWEALNGNIIQLQSYDPGAKDFSFPVKEMLSINESQKRFQRLKKVMGVVEYAPRRRQDVDVIFLAASNQKARLINPQFYHNRAGSVAVYGLSNIYAGQQERQKDIDLEGVKFCTIPWLFDEAYQGELSMQAMQDVWQTFPDRYLSLVAFGVDAYSVVAYLNELATTAYSGATGELVLNEYNRIERHLVCAQFKNGEVLLLEMADESNAELRNLIDLKGG